MNVKSRQIGPIPKPVHAIPMRSHGLIGVPYVRQHWLMDERWTASSISEEYKLMGNLIAKKFAFEKYEIAASHKKLVQSFTQLKSDCRNGRNRLQMCLYGKNQKIISSILINHRDMQRLYTKMPVHLVADNICQRTFVMCKERDRLEHIADNLKLEYENNMLEAAKIENRIKYQNLFVLEEEIRIRTIQRKIADSSTRLIGINTVNSAYKKMLQVLAHDEIFHEPIINSLKKDLKDQEAFINHVLYLGMPILSKYRQFGEENRKRMEKERKALTDLQVGRTSLKINRSSSIVGGDETKLMLQALGPRTDEPLRFERYTPSMKALRSELEQVTAVIKKVQYATLCSQAKQIYPRIKSQTEHNKKLCKDIENDKLGHENLENKVRNAELMQSTLINDLTEDEVKRLETIKKLKEDILYEEQIEAKILQHMKNRGDLLVLLRFCLWNLFDILRNVDRKSKISRPFYETSYLQLPLLKFEMLDSRACPPPIFEEEPNRVMHTIKRKLEILMDAFKQIESTVNVTHCTKEYNRLFRMSMQLDNDHGEERLSKKDEDGEEAFRLRLSQKILDNAAIKALSHKIVEENQKKEDL